jgi:hypothetical protein
MIDVPEKRAIIAGTGISRIGRRTGIPGIDLTVEASTAAITQRRARPRPRVEQPDERPGWWAGGGVLVPNRLDPVMLLSKDRHADALLR